MYYAKGKEARLKSLHTLSFHLSDILEKSKLKEIKYISYFQTLAVFPSLKK